MKFVLFCLFLTISLNSYAEDCADTNGKSNASLKKRCLKLKKSESAEKPDPIEELIKKLEKKEKSQAQQERDEIGELIKRLEKEKTPKVRDELGELIEKLERDAKVNNTERKNAIKEDSYDSKTKGNKASGREK